jgi:metal-responsive CopG/Arc/MetJ family transcriptional regulator
MAEEENRTFVNTPMESDLVEKLDEMVKDHGSSRAQFIRLLVRQKYDEYLHLKNIARRTQPRIKQVSQ